MTNLILVIDADNLQSANEFCNLIGAIGNTFSVGLYNTKNELKAYWAGWNMTSVQEEAISENLIFTIFDSPAEAIQATGLHPYQGGD